MPRSKIIIHHHRAGATDRQVAIDESHVQAINRLNAEKDKIAKLVREYRAANGGKPMPTTHPLAQAFIQVQEELREEMLSPSSGARDEADDLTRKQAAQKLAPIIRALRAASVQIDAVREQSEDGDANRIMAGAAAQVGRAMNDLEKV